MNSARKGPMSRDRPQAAAECSEDRVRTVAKPTALDSGPCALCVGQEAASNAEPTRTGHSAPVHATEPPHVMRCAHFTYCAARAPSPHVKPPHERRRTDRWTACGTAARCHRPARARQCERIAAGAACKHGNMASSRFREDHETARAAALLAVSVAQGSRAGDQRTTTKGTETPHYRRSVSLSPHLTRSICPRRVRRAAAVMSLILSAKLNGHYPHAYLRDVPTKSCCRVAGGSVGRCTRRQGGWPERLR